MRNLTSLTALALWLTPLFCHAQDQVWEIESLSPQNEFVYDLKTGTASGTNGVIIKYAGAVMTAERVTVDQNSGEAEADGNVRIQRDEQVWVGDHIRYNFKTRTIQADQFRSGRPPVFMAGRGLGRPDTNDVYFATNAITTTDDYSDPAVRIKTHKIKIVPGKYVEAYNSVIYVDGLPIFYLPYYRRSLENRGNHFNLTPGYRSRYGAFVLGSYDWFWNNHLDGTLHLDYRTRRGVAGGPDFNYHYGKWGEGTLTFYQMHDLLPNEDNFTGQNVPKDRRRLYFSHLSNPATNLTVRSQVRYQSDALIIRDFFESEHRKNPQPSTYVEMNKFWQNFSLNTYVQPRVNNFSETVERLPDVRLTGYRQQLGDTPIYYQSESSIAYLRRSFAITNGLATGMDYSATRADTYQQFLLPHSFFGWLNVTPHVGGRFTYYGDATGPGGTNSSASRGVFVSGVDVSFKSSRTFPRAESKLFDVKGIRHIIEPSVNFVYVPQPNVQPARLPQFDYSLPSLRLQPIDFPEMNSIDSIDHSTVARVGIRNRVQTKREGETADLLTWEIFTDWRMHTYTNETRFSDVYSLMTFSPRNWLTLNSETSFDAYHGRWRIAYNSLSIAPNNTWTWTLGHYYVRRDPVLGVGNNLFTSAFNWRLNENWAVQFTHAFEARDGHMEEQTYSLFRDLRSWTAELLFRARDNRIGRDDYTVAIVVSLKAFPRRLNLGGGGI